MNRRTYVTEVNIDRKRRDKETEKYYGRAYKDKIETIQAIDRYGSTVGTEKERKDKKRN